MRTSRQTNYQLNNENASTYNKIETPLNVGIGLYVHHQTRSKKLVNFLSDLNIGINYDKVLDIKKDIAIAILDKQEANGGVFVPSSLSNNKPLFFAIDNTDLSIDTPDGKKQLHGTAIAVFQQKDTYDKVSFLTLIYCFLFSLNSLRKRLTNHCFYFTKYH